MEKRAQGALEFLMTYGWAFLVILIMIGALAYFGVLNPQRFLPNRCQFPSEMMCREHVVKICTGAAAGNCVANEPTIALKLTNNFGTSIYIYGATVTTDVEGIATVADNITSARPQAYSGQMSVGFDADGDGLLVGALDADDDGLYDATEVKDCIGYPTNAADDANNCTLLMSNAPQTGNTNNKLSEGETRTVLFKLGDAGLFTVGAKHKININFKYYPTSSSATYAKTITGEIYTAVEG